MILATIVINWVLFIVFSAFFRHYAGNINTLKTLRLIGINNIFLFMRAALYTYSPAQTIFQAVAYTSLTGLITCYLCWWLHHYYGVKLEQTNGKAKD